MVLMKPKNITYSVITSLLLSGITPLAYAAKKNEKSTFKKVINSTEFKVGVGIAALAVGCGVMWMILKNRRAIIKLDSKNNQKAPLIVEKFKTQEIEELIGYETDSSCLGFEIQGRGNGPISEGKNKDGNWAGYKAMWRMAVANDNYIQIIAYYNNYGSANNFINKMSQLSYQNLGSNGVDKFRIFTEENCKEYNNAVVCYVSKQPLLNPEAPIIQELLG